MNTRPYPPALEILLADDGSTYAQAAAKWLCQLSMPPGSAVHVVGVLPPRESSHYDPLQTNLEKTRACLEASGLTVKAELVCGYPAEQILERAEILQPDLILMGARGLRATLGILLGGVSQQVVEYGHWPVMVFRPSERNFQRALVVVDGSPYSQKAVDWMARFPFLPETEVEVMHVLPPALSSDLLVQQLYIGPEFIPSIQSQHIEEEIERQMQLEEQEGEKILTECVTTLENAGFKPRTKLSRGDAATEVLHYLQQQEIDLVITGSRGLNPVKSWLLGSVSRKLIHYAPCSVVVVR